MPSLILPARFRQQPQSAPRLTPAYQDAELLAPCIDGTGSDIARANHLLPGIAPAQTIRQHGYTLNFNGSSHYLASSRAIKPAAQFSVFAWVRPAALNTSYARIIETDYTSGFYLGSNTASRYCWIVNNASLEGCIGGKQVVGQRDFVCGVFDGSNRILYVNGIQTASSAATAPSGALPVYISRWNNTPGYYWNGDIDTVAIFNRALGPSEIWSLYQNPWQLFKAPARRSWSASATNNLEGEGSVQGNAGGTAEIVQVHALAVIPVFQFNTIAAPAVTQSHALAPGGEAAQPNSGAAAAIRQSHALELSGAVAQPNSSAEGALTQSHALAPGGEAAQPNSGAAAAIRQSHALELSGGAAQSNSSAEAALTQSHALALSGGAAQSNSSTAATIRQGHALGANGIAQGGIASASTIVVALPLSSAPCNQTNATSVGQIAQAHALAIIPTLMQLNSSGAIATTQAHALVVANAAQANIGSSATIIPGTGNLAAAALLQANICGSAVIALAGAVPDVFRNPIAVSTAVKKPGIPRGTPEWLKTFLEIISGRRGNRIVIPPLEILTFSPTPTKAECEALYSYVNKVRASMADLINRLDG